LINGGKTNLYDWVEKIAEYFCEEQVVEEHTSLDNVKTRFYNDLHENILCTIPMLLQKFLIDKGVGHIVEPIPSLITPINFN